MPLTGIGSGLIGAGISAVGNLVGNLIGNSQNLKNQQKILQQQQDYNRELAEYQVQAQRENWSMENAYNTPANQIQRLRDAGLNPNLLYGNGSAGTGNASSVASPSLQHSPNAGPVTQSYGDLGMSQAFDAYMKIQSLKNMEAEAKLKSSQAATYQKELDLMNKRERILQIQADDNDLSFQFNQDTYDYRVGKEIAELRNTDASTENFRSQIDQRLIQNDEIQSRLELNGIEALYLQEKMVSECYKMAEIITNIKYTEEKTKGQKLENAFFAQTMESRANTLANIAIESLYRSQEGELKLDITRLEKRIFEETGVKAGTSEISAIAGAINGLFHL